MNPASSTQGREPQDEANRRTPNADMQAEDAGTPESGAEDRAGSGTPAEAAMKQTGKTGPETGNR
jgi:hypothetical protein